MHCVDLLSPAGTERMFELYLDYGPSRADTVMTLMPQVHSCFQLRLAKLGHRYRELTRWCGYSIPEKPKRLRRWHAARGARKADLVLFWNALPDKYSCMLPETRRAVYYDHGLAWFQVGRYRQVNQYFSSAVACSEASARVLRLHWDFRGPISVCPNPLTANLDLPLHPRVFPPERPFRIGMVGRLSAAKGFSLGLHTVAQLKQRNYACELHIAGDGPDRNRLMEQARRLGIADAVFPWGLVSDIASFYRRIDCLLHPSIIDAGSLVVREAAATGCPVVTSNIDGFAEWFGRSEAGILIRPDVPIDVFVNELDGGWEGVPAVSYDPSMDRLTEPAALDPATIAEAIRCWLDSPEKYGCASRASLEIAMHPQHGPENYVRTLCATLAAEG